MTSLPIPDADALAHSQLLVEQIGAEIETQGGWIDFARYMQLALYAPGLGYYSAGAKKFGAAGDFVTAPEISSLFGRTLALQVAEVLAATGGDVLELGAGTGRLAAQLLLALDGSGQLPDRYAILEVSADLRQLQQQTLAAALPSRLYDRVEWLASLPGHFRGVIVGNEVMDALPLHLVVTGKAGLLERGVTWQAGALASEDRPLVNPALALQANRLALPDGYLIEINLQAQGLMRALADSLQQGLILLVDYGFPRHEYYHPQRRSGTLMCHYRHHAHDDPFFHPGLQDITAHVDFTTLAEAGVAQGLQLMGYCNQAQFLINCGITDLLAAAGAEMTADYLPLAAQAQQLLSPTEMGELFKVLALGRSCGPGLLGFARGDKRHRL